MIAFKHFLKTSPQVLRWNQIGNFYERSRAKISRIRNNGGGKERIKNERTVK
jgi:hypothetical protein